MHGEMTAMAHAAIHGQKDVVAITGPNCHICKQLIWESALRSGYDIQIILKQEGVVRRVPISNLMQYPWPDAQGRH
jgi:cytidine deaminase